ncbi:hypothetical protein OS493_012958 [Desmophyllum pertusum]|uniref:Uncharacterized protein n=1 Tax=Desmophyllum pertusum TaxID=174260 RepID=A0A9W9Z1D6_9CNID|nr:hypothetical protein OS493_012958 [Desmophyllum pertusum]
MLVREYEEDQRSLKNSTSGSGLREPCLRHSELLPLRKPCKENSSRRNLCPRFWHSVSSIRDTRFISVGEDPFCQIVYYNFIIDSMAMVKAAVQSLGPSSSGLPEWSPQPRGRLVSPQATTAGNGGVDISVSTRYDLANHMQVNTKCDVGLFDQS